MKRLTILFTLFSFCSLAQVTPVIGINEVKNTTLAITWTAPASATSFEVQRSTDLAFSSPVSIYTGAAQIVEQSSLAVNTKYYFRVRAVYAGPTYSAWRVDSVKTCYTPTAVSQGGNRVATSGDLSLSSNIAVGDYLIAGTDTGPGSGGEFGAGIGGAGSGLAIPASVAGKKIHLLAPEGGCVWYDYVILNNTNNVGTTEVVTNSGGRAGANLYSFVGFAKDTITGKYDSLRKTGSKYFKGWDGDLTKKSGSFGIWGRPGNGSTTNSSFFIGGTSNDLYMTYIEAGPGGYAGGMIKNDSDPSPMIGVSVIQWYIHDVGGENLYIGSTQSDPQMSVEGFTVKNNAMLRCGLNGIQMGQMRKPSTVENNVILNSGYEWNNTFQRFQDQTLQFHSRTNGLIFRDNIVLGGAGELFNYFFDPYAPSGDSPQLTDTTKISNNLLTDFLSRSPSYFTPRDNFTGTLVVDSNYFGGFGRGRETYKMLYHLDTGFQYNRLNFIEPFSGGSFRSATRNNYLDTTVYSYVAFWAANAPMTTPTVTNLTRRSTGLIRPLLINYMDGDSSYDYSSSEQWAGPMQPRWNQYNRPGTQFEVIKNANTTTSSTNRTIPTAHPTSFTMTIGLGLRILAGERLDFVNGGNSFRATVTDYDSETGSVLLSSVSNTGTGTFNSWAVSLDIESILIYRTYNLGDIVRHNGRFYRSLINNNTNNTPSADGDSNWKLIVWSNGTLMPPDDVRLYADDFYALKGMGLTETVPADVIPDVPLKVKRFAKAVSN